MQLEIPCGTKRPVQCPGFVWRYVVIVLGSAGWWYLAAATAEVSSAARERSSPRTNAPVEVISLRKLGNSPIVLVETSRPVPYLTNFFAPTNRGLSSTAERVLELQIALVRQGISPGSLDGVMGLQSRAALRAFQQKQVLSVTGELDEATRLALLSEGPALTNYVITTNDLFRLQPLGKTWLAKSQQDRLDYETLLELVAEKSLSSSTLIRRLNPEIDWSSVSPGTSLKMPSVELPAVTKKAAFAKISLSERILQAFDETTNLLAHFPCSIAQRVEKRPVGELRVAALAANPNYTFDPEVFPEAADAEELTRKLILQPGPNNPVGTVWIGLDKSGYGIHGTPLPEQVGRTESHGCFRLANWNAEHLLKMAWIGMPVFVDP